MNAYLKTVFVRNAKVKQSSGENHKSPFLKTRDRLRVSFVSGGEQW